MVQASLSNDEYHLGDLLNRRCPSPSIRYLMPNSLEWDTEFYLLNCSHLLSWSCMVNDDNDEHNFEEHSFSRSNLSNVLWTVHDMSNLDPGRFVSKGHFGEHGSERCP